MLTKKFHKQSGSQYGKRVTDLEDAKRKVAQAVVERILWKEGQQPKNPVFISDGSSSSYVWCYYLRKWVRRTKGTKESDILRIWTNNLDVPMQVLCEKGAPARINVHVAGGQFIHKYCGNFGPDTEVWVEQHCRRSTCILAVTAFDAEVGPCGTGEDARAIKTAIMKAANVLIIVADHTKLRNPRDPAYAAAPDEWRRWRDERSLTGRLFVVTTRSPGISAPYPRHPLQGVVDNRTPDQIESENLAQLDITLHEQLIIV